MDFANGLLAVEHAGEAVLSDAKFAEWTPCQRFEEVVGITPRRIDDLIEFRDDSILNV